VLVKLTLAFISLAGRDTAKVKNQLPLFLSVLES
jgi:hypothetical protein